MITRKVELKKFCFPVLLAILSIIKFSIPVLSQNNIYKQQLEKSGIPFTEEYFLRSVTNGDTSIVRIFLLGGIRPTAKNSEGESALTIASEKGYVPIIALLLKSGADLNDFVRMAKKSSEKSKDFWDKASAFSTLGTVFGSLLIGAIGLWFTRSYNKRQTDLLDIQNRRNSDLSEQQNRILEMETIEKMIPHLTKDEETKRVALLAIKALARPELATQLAQLYPSEGSVKALQQMAETGNKEEKSNAIDALSNIATSNIENKSKALIALGNIFHEYKAAVVKIRKFQSGQTNLSLVSGIMISQEGIIVTTDYFVLENGMLGDDSWKYTVEMWDRSVYHAIVLNADADVGLAIIKINGVGFKTIRLAKNLPLIDASVIAVGAFFGDDVTAEAGHVHSMQEKFISIMLDNNSEILSGSGGGPILNVHGEAIGIAYTNFFDESNIRIIEDCIRCDTAIKYLSSQNITAYVSS
jgi:hypothetical protein